MEVNNQLKYKLILTLPEDLKEKALTGFFFFISSISDVLPDSILIWPFSKIKRIVKIA